MKEQINNKNYQEIKKFVESIISDPASRKEIVKRSHLYFFCTYFSKYLTYKMAPLHHELFRISEDDNINLAIISAFRNCGKSVIMNLSYILWAVLGKPQKKFILIVSQTSDQARQHFANLRRELETNELLKKDLGPFKQDFTWNNGALVIPKYNAKIMACSTEQSIRGLRYGEHRPDLLILDDIENINSVKTRESRDKTYTWFDSEITPIGDRKTKIIILGNILHQDSMIKRLESEIDAKTRDGIYREYPIMDDNDNILWPGKYPTIKEIDEEKRKRNRFTWLREFMLRIIDDKEPVIDPDWIHYYQELPKPLRNQGYAYAVGIDLAVSEKEHADYTAIVTAKVVNEKNGKRIYILPNPINAKVRMPDTINNIINIDNTLDDGRCKFYIEDVGTQRGLAQLLEEKKIETYNVKIGQNDKRTRLSMTSNSIKEGKILFPEKGCEELIRQILEFNTLKHDDLMDAFSTLFQGIQEEPPATSCGITIIDLGPEFKPRDPLEYEKYAKEKRIKLGPDGLPIRKDGRIVRL